MKKLFLLSMLVCTTAIFGMQERYMEPEVIPIVQVPPVMQQPPAPLIEQHDVPKVLTKAEAKKIAQQKKAIKALASFLTSKKLIKKLHVFPMRSAKPIKRILRAFFVYSDFHKDQLLKLKEWVNEFNQLATKSIPVFVRIGSYTLTSPHVQKLMESIQNGTVNELHESDFLDKGMQIDEQLAQDNPILYAQAQEIKQQWELFGQKWQPFFTELTPYVQSRMELHAKEFEQSRTPFAISMFFRNFGPGIGLGIEALVKVGKVKDIHDAQVKADLAKQIYNNVVANKTVLEDTIIACTQETFSVYGDMLEQVINESLKK